MKLLIFFSSHFTSISVFLRHLTQIFAYKQLHKDERRRTTVLFIFNFSRSYRDTQIGHKDVNKKISNYPANL